MEKTGFGSVRRPATHGTAMVVSRDPSHDARLVERVTARQAAQRHAEAVVLETYRALGVREHSGRRHVLGHRSFIAVIQRLVLVVAVVVFAMVILGASYVSVSIGVAAVLALTRTLVVTVHEELSARRLRLASLLLQLLVRLPATLDAVLERATLLAHEHHRLARRLLTLPGGTTGRTAFAVGFGLVGVAVRIRVDARSGVPPHGQVLDVIHRDHRTEPEVWYGHALDQQVHADF